MASHNVYTFFSVHNCLDDEFDAVDAASDHDLCQAIVAGKAGMHPEAWDARSDLTAVMPQGFHGYEWVPEAYRQPIVRSAAAIAEQKRENTEWEAKHRRRPVEESPIKPARRKPRLQLTCDVCHRHRLGITLEYRGDRTAKVAEIRVLGSQQGWTCIAGTDRCPACSQAAAPKSIGNGAGGNQGDEQHA